MSSLDMRVIVLVRDPRAILASRIHIEKIGTSKAEVRPLVQVLEKECRMTVKGFKDYADGALAAYKERIYYTRFEDGAVDMTSTENDLYSFIDVSRKVTKYPFSWPELRLRGRMAHMQNKSHI